MIDMDEIQYVATTCWFVEAHAKFICTRDIQGREVYWCDLMKYMFNMSMWQNTCETICFKLGMMLHTTMLYGLILVWMTLMFTQGHRITGRLELVKSLCCKIAWSNSNFCDGWLLIHMSILWIYVVIHVCLSSRLAVLHSKNCNSKLLNQICSYLPFL